MSWTSQRDPSIVCQTATSSRALDAQMAGPWSAEATEELVAVWSNENVQNQLDGVSRNRTIFEKIAKEM